MPDAADFAALFSSLKAITELTKLLIDARDATVVRAKAIELQREIITAQSSTLMAQASQFALLDRVRNLEKEVTDLKAWDAEKEKYELKDLRPSPVFERSGALAYALKKDAGSSEPFHLLCAKCYQDGRKSILQQEVRPGFIEIMYCQSCGGTINLTGPTH
jgi:hypothetical protein